eukprot:2104833-Pleurochrysis_carterae.AAC.1
MNSATQYSWCGEDCFSFCWQASLVRGLSFPVLQSPAIQAVGACLSFGWSGARHACADCRLVA